MRLGDKLTRVSALRPALRRARPVNTGLPASADVLGKLLGAVCVRNHYGQHLVRQQWCSTPVPCPAPNGALELLAPDLPRQAADPRNWLFLDTETTGLAGGTGTYAFLVGVAWWDAGGLQVEQFFMRDYTEEHALLLALAARIHQRPVLVTFNGKSFDWPLLETRYRMTRTIAVPEPVAHLDLLHPARQLWRLRLDSLRLTQLERHVLGVADTSAGWSREFDVRSELIPQIYFDYLRGGPVAPLADVFRHNQMDLRGLAALAGRVLALLDDPTAAEGDALELYGLSRLLRRRGQRPRARQMYERALDASLPARVDRAARRELAALAKRDRDFPRATSLWHDLVGACAAVPEISGGRSFSSDISIRKKTKASASEEFSEAEAKNLEHHSAMSNPKVRPSEPPAFLICFDAYEQLAMYYEHQAHQPARALELTRAALGELRRAQRLGLLDPARCARLRARLDRRAARLAEVMRKPPRLAFGDQPKQEPAIRCSPKTN
jgi:uncharacterized protein YprB with RNaseH-like and TPR domain